MKTGRKTLLTLLGLLLASGPAHADTPATSKKDKRLQDKVQAATLRAASPSAEADKKKWHKALNRRVGRRVQVPVTIYNTWTHEFLTFDPWDMKGPPAKVVNRFLRCHFTNAPAEMDPRLLRGLLKAARHFKARRINIVSGFRAPKYNLTLRKKGRQVARNSEHTLGHAIDFRIPGVSVDALHNYARSLRLGGVGFYSRSRFIHMDVGKIRFWNGT